MIQFDYDKIVKKNVWIRCYNIEQAKDILEWAKSIGFKWTNGDMIDIDIIDTRKLYWDYSYKFMAYNFYEGKVSKQIFYDKSFDIIEFCDSVLLYNKKQSNTSKYKLVKNTPKKRYYEVTIKADYNDADYIEESQCFYQEEFDEVVDDIIDLKNNYGGRHGLEDYENDRLDIPYSEDGDKCHTLAYIDIIMYDTDGCSYVVEI